MHKISDETDNHKCSTEIATHQENLKALYFTIQIQLTIASKWDTYPQIPKTASINGFADLIYNLLPNCARSCVEKDTFNTPCPYWDTGCFCVMPQWSGIVADCFVEQCDAEDVVSASSLAFSLCSSVGANQWLLPASISTEISEAMVSTHTAITTIEGTYTFSSTKSNSISNTKETGSSNSDIITTADTNYISSILTSSLSTLSTSSSNGGVTFTSACILTVIIQVFFSLIL